MDTKFSHTSCGVVWLLRGSHGHQVLPHLVWCSVCCHMLKHLLGEGGQQKNQNMLLPCDVDGKLWVRRLRLLVITSQVLSRSCKRAMKKLGELGTLQGRQYKGFLDRKVNLVSFSDIGCSVERAIELKLAEAIAKFR
jgi:hypothetical protein